MGVSYKANKGSKDGIRMGHLVGWVAGGLQGRPAAGVWGVGSRHRLRGLG